MAFKLAYFVKLNIGYQPAKLQSCRLSWSSFTEGLEKHNVKNSKITLFLKFSSVSVTDFHNVLRLQQVIALRHSVAFQCNLVHEQTTLLSPTTCFKKYTTCSFRFCIILAFLKNGILQITRRVNDCKSGEFGSNTETSKPCII